MDFAECIPAHSRCPVSACACRLVFHRSTSPGKPKKVVTISFLTTTISNETLHLWDQCFAYLGYQPSDIGYVCLVRSVSPGDNLTSVACSFGTSRRYLNLNGFCRMYSGAPTLPCLCLCFRIGFSSKYKPWKTKKGITYFLLNHYNLQWNIQFMRLVLSLLGLSAFWCWLCLPR